MGKLILFWKRTAENHINMTKPSEYSIAIGYLKRIQKVMKMIKNESTFNEYVQQLRRINKKKIQLIEMLDFLTDRRIVDM